MKYSQKLTTIVCSILCGSTAFALPVSSDLASFTSTPTLVDQQRFQIETRALDYIRGNNSMTLARLLAKYGVNDDVDLEFSFDGYHIKPSRRYFAGFRSKISLVSNSNFAFSMIPNVSIPTYGNPFTAGFVVGIIAPASFQLNEKTKLALQLSFLHEGYSTMFQSSAKLEKRIGTTQRGFYRIQHRGETHSL